MNPNKIVFIIIGIISLSIGYIGAFVPGLPTTVFVLIALVCFTKSSQKLEKKLRSIPVFKQAIAHSDEYIENRTISKKVKIIAQTFAWSSVLFVSIFTGLTIALFLTTIAAISCSVFMYYTKSK